jgi:hypothetical protein
MFSNDLLRMPPERAIELQPGLAPIAKSLYWMTLVELVELKIQLQDLLNKGYTSIQADYLGVVQPCL